jgi:hypothetical protein
MNIYLQTNSTLEKLKWNIITLSVEKVKYDTSNEIGFLPETLSS